ncbi:hypothetical protein PMAYCL1PPCAC_11240, partial [Pristionchus mayeri]
DGHRKMSRPLLIAICILGASAAMFNTRQVVRKALQANYAGQCAANDQAKTKSCLDTYFKYYGIDTSKGLPEFAAYANLTNSLVLNYDLAGFDIYCDFESTLEGCLGSLMTSACMNPDGFTKMYGVNENDAVGYATTFPVESYTCQNKDLAKKYFPCMMDMEKSDHLQGLIDCTTVMENEIESATDPCLPLDHYVTCIETVYVKFCDKGIQEFVCNTEELAFNFEMDGKCKDKLHHCSSSSSISFIGVAVLLLLRILFDGAF